jgi:hypothetical protein
MLLQHACDGDGVLDGKAARRSVVGVEDDAQRLLAWPDHSNRIEDLQREAQLVLQRATVLVRALVG